MALTLANAQVVRLVDLQTADGGSYRIGFFRGALMAGGADTYSTGGENVDARRYFRVIDHVEIERAEDSAGGLVMGVDDTNFATGQFLVELFRDVTPAATADFVESAAGVDLSAHIFRIMIMGYP